MSAINCTPEEVSAYYAERVPHLKQFQTDEWRGPCPIHHGKKDNFAVNPVSGVWFCHSECGHGGDILKLEKELSGSDFPTCKAKVLQLLSVAHPVLTEAGAPAEGLKEVERYPYQNVDGDVLFEVVRYEKPDGSKDFRQCRPDSQGGVIWGLGGVERVPYRLPKLPKAETVYLPEGEKDVHTLEKWGLVGSCNPGGAGNSNLYNSWAKYFEGCHVVILPDNDEPGRKHAVAVASALLSVAASIRIVKLPGLPAKGDVTDWRDEGGTFEEFSKLTEAAEPLVPAALSALRKLWGQAGQKANPKGSANVLATRRLSDIDAKPVSWLWPGRIARGKVSIIAGNPGLGKSQLASSIGAIVTTGGIWPVDQQKCDVGNVVFLNAEDDPADTLRPRLEAAGADLNRVHFVDGVIVDCSSGADNAKKTFSLGEDLKALGKTLEALGNVAAVVIDPITAFLGKVDSHKNADVRALLAPLGELAARYNTAIIGVSHLTKATGPQALMRVSGSLAFVAAARAAFLVSADPQDKARRLFLPMKNNIGPDHEGLAFHIEPATIPSSAGPLSTSRVVWESQPVSMTADEVMQSEMGPQNVSALAEATEWLQATLAAGPVCAAQVKEEAKAAGITSMTLRRAADALHVVKQKASMNGGWLWSLPGKVLSTGEVVQQKPLITFGNLEHLLEMADKL
jgi:putative DNA primase/helicase